MRKQKGFSLLEIVATLAVIVGVIAATGYYRGRPAGNPTSIDASLPNIAETTKKIAQTNYYLEGTVHKVVRNMNGAYFMVETASGKRLYVVGTQALSGGLSQVAAGQVAAMQVQLNTGSSLTASVQVVSPAQAVDVSVYKYMVKSPAPAHYVDPEAEEAQDKSAPTHTAKAKDDD